VLSAPPKPAQISVRFCNLKNMLSISKQQRFYPAVHEYQQKRLRSLFPQHMNDTAQEQHFRKLDY